MRYANHFANVSSVIYSSCRVWPRLVQHWLYSHAYSSNIVVFMDRDPPPHFITLQSSSVRLNTLHHSWIHQGLPPLHLAMTVHISTSSWNLQLATLLTCHHTKKCPIKWRSREARTHHLCHTQPTPPCPQCQAP